MLLLSVISARTVSCVVRPGGRTKTAQLYGESLALPIYKTAQLRELDHGNWEGTTVRELLLDQSSGYAKWLSDPGGIAIPGGSETVQAAPRRDWQDYDGPRWANRLAKLTENPSEQELVSFDTALTISMMRYIRAVHVGRVNPKQFKFEPDVGDGLAKLADFVGTVASASDPAAEIQKLEPPFLGYRQLLALLPVYEDYARQDDGEKLQTTAKTVRPGQPYGSLSRLGRFLHLIGDIPADAKLDPNPTVYHGALVDGVKHYQSRHGESPTGLLDARTISELNTAAPLRIRQIKLTLERCWLPHSALGGWTFVRP